MFSAIKERKRKNLIAVFEKNGYTTSRSMIICPEAVIVEFDKIARLIIYPKVFGYKAYYYRDVSDCFEPTIFDDADKEFLLMVAESIRMYPNIQ